MDRITKGLIESRLLSTTGYLGTESNRSDWERGWNAAMGSISHRRIAVEAWYRKLTNEQAAMFTELLGNGPLDLEVDENAKEPQIEISAPCSDMFMWACSDSEPLTLDELPEYYAAWKANAADLWICKRREMQPQKPIVDMMKESGNWTAEWEAIPRNPYDEHCIDGPECRLHGAGPFTD